MTVQNPSLTGEIAATLEWWRAAGVDLDFADDATAWLGDAPAQDAEALAQTAQDGNAIAGPGNAQPQSPEALKPAGPVDLLGESPPTTLEQFHEFWLSAPGLDTIGPRGRITPRGTANPEVMVLVIDPEATDRDRLLSGPLGQLVANMLGAMGIDEDATYFASALPRHTPMPDTAAAAQAGLGAILSLHIRLVAPKRLIAFGSNILPLLQHGITSGECSLREINQNAPSGNLMVSEGLDSLMAMPRLKTKFWRRWIEWSAQDL